MAIELENLRALSKGEVLPELTGEALDLSNERSTLRKESIEIKSTSEGRDEIPGTPEFERLQVIGKRLKDIKKCLEELQK